MIALFEELESILLEVLSNPTLITDELIQKAIADAEEIVGAKDLEIPFFLDIALYRFFVRVRAKAPQSVKDAYEKAIARLQKAPIKKSSLAKVAQRQSIWI